MRSLLWSALLFVTVPRISLGPDSRPALVWGPSVVVAQVQPVDTANRPLLRRIEARFREVAREELGLTDDQSNRVWAIQTRRYQREGEIEREEKRLNQLLAAQLRPGVAADPAQVTRALDSLGGLRMAQGRVFADEQRELATFLTPVQRAQLYRLRARINTRVMEMIRERGAPGERAARRRP